MAAARSNSLPPPPPAMRTGNHCKMVLSCEPEQIELVRRQAYGTASEILGEKALRGDLLARTFAFAEWGRRSREAMRQDYPDEAQLIEAFLDAA